jgi:5'-3' exonuclease
MIGEAEKAKLRDAMRHLRAKGPRLDTGEAALLITLERQHGYDLDALDSTFPELKEDTAP